MPTLFFYHFDYVLEAFLDRLSKSSFRLKEILTNRTLVLEDGEFNYPIPLSRLPALAMWHDHSLAVTIENEMQRLDLKFHLLKELFQSLKSTFPGHDFTMTDGQMRFTHLGITKTFDSASLLDDIQHARFEDRAHLYLENFSYHGS